MHSSWKSRGGGGGVLGFCLANYFEGVTWGCEKIRGGHFLLHFYVEVFQKSLWGEVHEAPPSPSPPLCASMVMLNDDSFFSFAGTRGTPKRPRTSNIRRTASPETEEKHLRRQLTGSWPRTRNSITTSIRSNRWSLSTGY